MPPGPSGIEPRPTGISQDDVTLMTQIGILYLKINEYQRAFEKLLDAIALDDKCTTALLALGSILQVNLHRDFFKRKKNNKISPSHAHVNIEVGFIFQLSNLYSYRRRLGMERNLLVLLPKSKNDIDGALNKYKRISNLPDEGSEVWSNIGLCFFKKQKYIAAISCLKKAIWVAPLNFNALYNLGLILVTAQQYVSAFQTLAAAISLRPDNADCYMLLGTCLRHLNDPGNAYLSLEKSTMLPDAIKNPLIYLNFALYCYEIGKPDQSVSYLSNFLEMTQHVSVHREYLKMADRLNMALLSSVTEPEPTPQLAASSGVVTTGGSSPVGNDDTGIQNEATTAAKEGGDVIHYGNEDEGGDGDDDDEAVGADETSLLEDGSTSRQ
ncbi:tetratricopeptide repeat protein [Culex quinquefasciatus]|uniref:Tetratricopeptide repeat protein n=1 Tax=Culex quinquefasciatus TaxID=7176 RepID=B0WHK9_CULQU|nr:tetratricopeptide repeat protein [Culex quinquefasciatus]|eukprot:XP_001848193.1 tetratricopeptide repeat protein [Culex quinquefasciatus]